MIAARLFGVVLAGVLITDGSPVAAQPTTGKPQAGSTTRAVELVVQSGHTAEIRALEYARNGRFFATAGKDSTIRILVAGRRADPDYRDPLLGRCPRPLARQQHAARRAAFGRDRAVVGGWNAAAEIAARADPERRRPIRRVVRRQPLRRDRNVLRDRGVPPGR